MRKIILFATISALTLSLFGCSSGSRLGRMRGNTAKAKEIMREIIVLLDAEDKQGLKEMFSEAALQEANDLDASIDSIMEFYQGTMQDFDGNARTSESWNRDGTEKEFAGQYNILTDIDSYRIRYVYHARNDMNPEVIGLYSLQIVRQELREQLREQGGFKWKPDDAGIYIFTE